MRFARFRWRAERFVRSLLLKTRSDSHAHGVYRALRRVPGVSAAWRSLTGKALDDWRDVARYTARDGAFAAELKAFPAAPPEFESDQFFENLVERIEANHPAEANAQGAIVLVNNGLSAGGAERQIVFTLTGLKARGEKALFVGEYLNRTPGHGFYLSELDRAGVHWCTPKQIAAPGRDFYAQIARPVAEALAVMPSYLAVEILDMAATLRALRPRVVHLWLDETSTKIGLAALIAGAPRVVLSGRNVNPTHFNFHQAYMRPAYRALSRSPRVALSNNSRAGAQSYADWIGLQPDDVAVVYNAVDFSAWPDHDEQEKRAFRSAHGINDDSPLIVGVFRLADEKRPLLWLEAAAQLCARRPNAAFVIAGDGPMRAEAENAAARLGMQTSLHFLGETRNVSLLYAAADVFFLASRQEGTPNVVIEAQRYGLPVVSTDAGGAAETFEPGVTGILVADATAAGLAGALDEILADTNFRALARRRGPEFVARRFGLDRMIDDTLALYAVTDAAVGERRPPV